MAQTRGCEMILCESLLLKVASLTLYHAGALISSLLAEELLECLEQLLPSLAAAPELPWTKSEGHLFFVRSPLV